MWWKGPCARREEGGRMGGGISVLLHCQELEGQSLWLFGWVFF